MQPKHEIRRNQIIQLLKVNENMSVSALSEQLNVTKETIRADLTYLEKKGSIYRTHGSASIRKETKEIPFEISKQEGSDLKKDLAYAMIEFIKDDMVVFLASSSTALHLTKLLKLKRSLTIFTNSLEVALQLSDTKHKLIIVGGEYYDSGKRMMGSYASSMIKNVYFDLCIVGMDGCLNIDGPATTSHSEQMFISDVLSRSKYKFLVSDHTKFNKFANYKYYNFSDFDLFITDKLANKEDRAKFKRVIEIKK